jgi:hypothetical protein
MIGLVDGLVLLSASLLFSAPPDGECTGRIGNFIWNDLNANGIQDLDEPGLGGVRIVLTDPEGNVLDEYVSQPNGYYILGGNLCAGPYVIQVDESTLPPGFVPSPCEAGNEIRMDSDCQPVRIALPDDTHRALRIDFGYYLRGACTGSIGDFVWNDLDGDGLQDDGEPGIPGVILYLTGPGGLQDSTITDEDGRYAFNGLCAGSYRVDVDPASLPPGFSPTLCDAGFDDTIDNDCSPRFVVLPADDTQDTTNDFGYNAMDMACRLTAGGRVRNRADRGQNAWSVGGQVGAPTGVQPQPCGEWTHSQLDGPAGRFTFHAGTASAPEGTEIAMIQCSDPDPCRPASNPAPAKQVDFWGVGRFTNVSSGPFSTDPRVIPGTSQHWFEVHCEDLGEPGNGGHSPIPEDLCPPEGSAGRPASCECPDFYRITIHATTSPGSAVIYEVHGYLDGGNFQTHEPTRGSTCR